MPILTITNNDLQLSPDDYNYNYQPYLTNRLENTRDDFNQEILNEIVLWKVNRYAHFENDLIAEINQIDSDAIFIDYNLIRHIFNRLLNTNGVGLPMASTILRFKNKNVFQIIDQRVYRILYGVPLKVFTERNITEAIEVYINYLIKLKEVCIEKNIEFSESDRVLYMMDKRVNGGINIH